MSKKYPSIKDEEFYDKINKIYKNFTIPKHRSHNPNKFCRPRKFKLQPTVF